MYDNIFNGENNMTTLDFLLSEYDWCLAQYARLGYAHYMLRAMELEVRIEELNQDSMYESFSKAA